jgi:hypothetical protein
MVKIPRDIRRSIETDIERHGSVFPESEVPQELSRNEHFVIDRILAWIDENQWSNDAVIAREIIEKIKTELAKSSPDIGTLINLSIYLGRFATIAQYRPIETTFAAGKNRQVSASMASKKAARERKKPVPSDAEFKRAYMKYSKQFEKASTIKTKVMAETEMSKNQYYEMLKKLKS